MLFLCFSISYDKIITGNRQNTDVSRVTRKSSLSGFAENSLKR